MPILNVLLTTDQEQRIAALVQAGRYTDATSLLREGLRLVEQQEAARAAQISNLHPSIATQGPARRPILVAEFEEPEQAAYGSSIP